MNEDGKDLKEIRMVGGPIQEFANNENKLANDDRKEQMIVGLRAERNIHSKIREQENKKIEQPKVEIKPVEDPKDITEYIKRKVEGENIEELTNRREDFER